MTEALLLDTHAIIWWLADDRRLSRKARAAIAEPERDVWVSSAVGYEIALKQGRGLLPYRLPDLSSALRREGFLELTLSLDHMLKAGALPGPHRDPWDRIMIAQAGSEGLIMVSADPVFHDYGVAILW